MGLGSTIGGFAGSALGSLAGPPGTIIIGAVGSITGRVIEQEWAAMRQGRSQQRYTADGRRYRTRGGAVLSSAQVQNMFIVQDVLNRARLPWPLGTREARYGLSMAMIANAYAESLLDPKAAGDGGWSIGLFQANRKAGAGRGHTVAELEDPRYNTVVILGELVDQVDRFRMPLQRGTTGVELTKLFSTYVERPADKPDEEVRRARIVVDIFGDLATETIRV